MVSLHISTKNHNLDDESDPDKNAEIRVQQRAKLMGNIKWGVGKPANFEKGWIQHWEGLFPTRLLCNLYNV